MKKHSLIVFVLIILAACSTISDNKKNIINSNPAEFSSLNKFFKLIDKDIKNATGVIVQKNLVRYLTHFQRMNNGGRKYHLLERESISKMIKAVTIGMYEDFILTNRHGTVIYTMRNDRIFSKKINDFKVNSPLNRCFTNTNAGLYISDISEYPPSSERLNLFLSNRVIKERNFEGILILQIDIEKIVNLFEKKSFVIDRNGKYRITGGRVRMFTPYPNFDMTNMKSLEDNRSRHISINNRIYSLYPFRYKNLFWVIVSE